MVGEKLSRHKTLLAIAGLVVLAIVAFGIMQVRMLNKAHSTFENYYKFRGCTELLSRTATEGTCRTSKGQIIKIVLYNGKWYLDGDLPKGFWGHLN